MLCSNIASVAERYTVPSSPIFYRAPGAPVVVELAAAAFTTPLVAAAPLSVSSTGHEHVELLCGLSLGTGAVAAWPWEFRPDEFMARHGRGAWELLGDGAHPCLTVEHSTTHQATMLSSVAALPLHDALIRAGAPPSEDPFPHYPVNMPFLQSLSSAILLTKVRIQGFGFVHRSAHPFHNDELPATTGGSESVEEALLRGGGIGLSGAVAELRDVHITGCSAVEGGGIYAFDSEVALLDSAVEDNAALHRGGGVSISGGIPLLQRVTVAHNAVKPWRSQPLSNPSAADAADVSGGGGLFCFGVLASTLSIADSTVWGNSVATQRLPARDMGGGVASIYCRLSVNGTEFIQNTVGSRVLAETSAAANSEEWLDNGGALFASRSHGRINGCWFEGNTAGRGGAISLEESSDVAVTDSGFLGNAALRSSGGGLLLSSPFGPVTLQGVAFESNAAPVGFGGGIALLRLPVSDVRDWLRLPGSLDLVNNTANEGGGGIYYETANGRHYLVDRVAYRGNAAAYGADFASDARRLLVEAAEDPVRLRFDEPLPVGALTAVVVDESGAVVASWDAVMVTLDLVRAVGQGQLKTTALSASFLNGRAALAGPLQVPLAPGTEAAAVLTAHANGNNLESQPLVIAIRPCDIGYFTSDYSCKPCPAGKKSCSFHCSPTLFHCSPTLFHHLMSQSLMVWGLNGFTGTYGRAGALECSACPPGMH